LVVGGRVWKTLKRKTAPCKRGEKEIYAKTENDLVVGIPMVRRLSPVVVEPQPILIAVDIEDVRITVRVGLYGAPSIALPARAGAWLYFICDRKSPSASHQVFLFLRTRCALPAKSRDRSRSQYASVGKVSKSHGRSIKPNRHKYNNN